AAPGRIDGGIRGVESPHQGQSRPGARPLHLRGRSARHQERHGQIRGDQMMRTLRWFVIVAVAVALQAPATARAQSKVGTSARQFLMIEPRARFAGRGNAATTGGEAVQAAYFNPAAIGYLDRYAAEFTHAAWYADIAYDYAAVAIPLGKERGNLVASLTSLNSCDIEVRTVSDPLATGELYHVSDVSFALGYGRRMTTLFSLGFTAHYVQETIMNTSARTGVLSAGTLYRLSDGGLEVGSSLSFFGTGE